MPTNGLRRFWTPLFSYHWKLGLFLLVLVCVPRFLMVLQANQTSNYGPIGAIMLVSALVPFLFLNKDGRKEIGIRGTKKPMLLLVSLMVGIIISLLLYWFGNQCYGTSFENWYVYIGQSYQIPVGISADQKFIMFLIMAITGMLFSPIGEELFFRGIVHQSFANSLGAQKASLIDSSAFALTHIAHFGWGYLNGNWHFYMIPALLWVVSMFLVSQLFFKAKQVTGSLLGAICCHAGFNLGMIYAIFYLLP